MNTQIQDTGFYIDHEAYLVYNSDKPITFAKKEFELICLLASRPGKVFRRKEIIDAVWNGELNVDSRTIDVHVRRIRKKLGDDIITTIIGVGYKLKLQKD